MNPGPFGPLGLDGETGVPVRVGTFVPSIVEDLKFEARSRGLWNLFLPGISGLTNVE